MGKHLKGYLCLPENVVSSVSNQRVFLNVTERPGMDWEYLRAPDLKLPENSTWSVSNERDG